MAFKPKTKPGARRAAGLAVLVVAGLLQACATKQNPDPLEPWNRKVFTFNDKVDENVLQPVAKGYKAVTPEPVRTAVRNVFNNVGDVWSTINLFLQGRFKDGYLGVVRVTVNSTFGLGGLLDIATPMQIPRQTQDFGVTLGVWGVKSGAYIVWPILGSSTLRDSMGIPGDFYFSPSTLATYPREANVLTALGVVSMRANLLGASGLLDDVALDKYAFVRAAYLQRRQNLIYDGNPPDDDDDASSPPDASASATSSAASAPSLPAPATEPASAAEAASAAEPASAALPASAP